MSDLLRLVLGTETNPYGFDIVVFPLIRSVFPKLAAAELVAVQPLSIPTGLMFTMDFRYGMSLINKDAPNLILGDEST